MRNPERLIDLTVEEPPAGIPTKKISHQEGVNTLNWALNRVLEANEELDKLNNPKRHD